MRRTHQLLVVSGLLVATVAPAAGEEDERRLTLAGQVALVTVDAYGTSDTNEAYGGALSFAWGARDWLDVGAEVAYLVRPNATLQGAVVDGVGGEDFVLYTNFHAVELASEARFAFIGWPFHRLRPILGVRAGVAYRLLADPQLFDATGGTVLSANAESGFVPLAGATAGMSYRLSDGFQVAAMVTTSFAAEHQVVGLQLDVSWLTYRLF